MVMKYLALILWSIVIVNLAQAQTPVVEWIDLTCANDGDGLAPGPNSSSGTTGTCASGAGLSGPFNTLASWEAQNADITAAGLNQTRTVWLDGNASTITVETTLNGWTTDATHWIVINWGAGVKMIRNTSTGYGVVMNDDYTTINGGWCEFTRTDVSTGACLRLSSANDILVDGMVIKHSGTCGNSTSDCKAVDFPQNAENNQAVTNLLIYGPWDIPINMGAYSGSGYRAAYNNTVDGALEEGIAVDRVNSCSGVGFLVKNNIVNGSANADYSITNSTCGLTTITNYTSDGTSPDGASYQSKTFAFTDSGTGDYSLDATDSSGARTGGTDLSSDTYVPFSEDIEGTTRSGWSAGAYEYVAASGPGNEILLLLEDY